MTQKRLRLLVAEGSPGEAAAALHATWLADWRFLVTADDMSSEDFEGRFHGMHLPRAVVDKIYRRNARTLFPHAWSKGP